MGATAFYWSMLQIYSNSKQKILKKKNPLSLINVSVNCLAKVKKNTHITGNVGNE